MSNIRFSQLPTVQLLKDSDILAISSPDTSTPPVYTSAKSPISQVASKIVEDTTFTTSLKTTNKTVAGSINETLSNFANEYSTSSAYAVGDCVLYAGSIYQCTTAIPSGEAWDSTHWTQIKAVDVGSGGGGGSSTLAGLSDVTLSSPSDGQVLKYDSTSQKWINSTGGGSSGDHVTLTQAEYDALVQAGTVDPDAFYFITDTNGDGQDFQPVIYSLEEREIGVWTDGKPLYEKTIARTFSADEAYTVFASGIDIAFITSCYFEYTSGSSRYMSPYYISSASASNNISINSDVSSGALALVNQTRSSKYFVVTFRYTKSTDQAGSGTWTPQGVPAIHYSMDEKIVGTWVDGSTLYEKTVYYAGGTTGQINIPHNITNISKCVDLFGTCHDIGYGSQHEGEGDMPLPRIATDDYNVGIAGVNTTNINISVASIWGSRIVDFYITLRYTKTST